MRQPVGLTFGLYGLSSRLHHLHKAALVALLVGTSAVAGAAVTIAPALAMGIPAVGMFALLAWRAEFRAALLVFGGLAVLQSSQDLSGPKLVYFVASLVATIAAANSAWTHRKSAEALELRPIFISSLFLALLAAISAMVSAAHLTPVELWFRDITPYLLLAAVPIFALDLAAAARPGAPVVLLATGAAIATGAFAAEWFTRRQLVDVPIERFALPSFALAGALFAHATAYAMRGRSWNILWSAVAASIITAGFMTGTRSTLVMLAAPVAILLIGGRLKLRRSLLLFAMWFFVTAGVVVGLSALVASLTGADLARATERFTSVTVIFEDPVARQSLDERAIQTQLALDAFWAEPLFGVGPGRVWEWTGIFGQSAASTSLDTTMSFPAKFGVIGVILLLMIIATYAKFVRASIARRGLSLPIAALVGYAAIGACNLWLGISFEDKGFAFGLILLLAPAAHSPNYARPR